MRVVSAAVEGAARRVQDAAESLPTARVGSAVSAAGGAVPGSQTASALAGVAATLDAELTRTRTSWLTWSEGGRDAIVAYATSDRAAVGRLAPRTPGASVAE